MERGSGSVHGMPIGAISADFQLRSEVTRDMLSIAAKPEDIGCHHTVLKAVSLTASTNFVNRVLKYS